MKGENVSERAERELIEEILGKRVKKANRGKTLLRTAVCITVIAAVAYVMFGVVFGAAVVKGTSMAPCVSSGSPLLYFRMGKNYVRGDVAVFRQPDGNISVRRVVATSGDTVDIDDETGELTINGMTEKNLNASGATYSYSDGISFPLTVGAGEVFVLGDNREGCVDSRVYG